MKELTKEKTMTMKELRGVLDIPRTTLQDIVNRVFPNKLKKGVLTHFTEKEVSIISRESKKAHNTDMTGTRQVATTETEENEILLNAMTILVRRKEALENKVLEMTPKAKFFDTVQKSNQEFSISEVAKMIGYGPNNLFKALRMINILMANNKPYQRFIDSGAFRYVQGGTYQVKGDLRADKKPVMTQKGIHYIIKRLGINEETTI